MLKGKLLGLDVAEARGGVSDAKRIDVGLVVATSLVRAHEQLDLQVVGNLRATLEAQATRQTSNAAGHARNQIRRRLEGLGDGHVAALHVAEVDLP